MKKILALFALVCISLVSCSTTKKSAVKANSLEGTWVLNFITGPKIAFNGLYPNSKPTIAFDLSANKISGNNSCNQYFGTLIVDGTKINFKDAKMGMTMMACQGNGDTVYMSTLDKVDSYSITNDGKTLNFIMGSVVMMRFIHKI
jgi:heat shock protein HslJ